MRDSALYLLDIYPVSDSSEGASQTLPDFEEVNETLRSLMPNPVAIITERLIKESLFPISQIRDLVKLFKFGNAHEDTIIYFDLTELDKRNKSIMKHLCFLNCELETI